MRVGVSYKQTRLDDRYDTIVVGSGLGGLTAGALLARHAEQRVLVLERHYTAGGFTHAFFRPGYEWDVGVHYVGDVAPGRPLRRLFDEVSDGQLDWAEMGPVYDRVIIDGDVYDFHAGRQPFVDGLVEHFPDERHAIETFARECATISKSYRLFLAEKAASRPVAALAGGFMRREFLRSARRTVDAFLKDLTPNRRLRGVLAAQWGDYGLPPKQASFAVHALVANHYRWGAYYPVGSATRMAQTIVPVIERAGGRVVTNAEVKSVRVEGKRVVGVTMADGKTLLADRVVSAIGVINTFDSLLPEDIEGRAALKKLQEKRQGLQRSTSHASLYIGAEHPAEQLGLPKHNLWIFPSDDHDANVSAFLADPENAPLPVVFVSFPSAKDPTFEERHPGRATVEAVTLVPWAQVQQWQATGPKSRDPGYLAFKQRLEERLLEVLDQHVPQLRGAVAFTELSTPLSTRRFAGHSHGEIYGLSHDPGRFEHDWLRARSFVPGLFFAGVDIATAGLGGALISGAIAASAITGQNLVEKIMKSAPPAAGRTAAGA